MASKRRTFRQMLAMERRAGLLDTLTEEAATVGRIQAQVGERAIQELESQVSGWPPFERLRFWRRVERQVESEIDEIVESGLDLPQEMEGWR